ncbi:hypothetical protein NIES4073_47340 [Kalymmatonema gypsitolerans NIES-4073]|nr:hypothetical protein NIES4073_47340 [Scytonema sp. NIES-4073]
MAIGDRLRLVLHAIALAAFRSSLRCTTVASPVPIEENRKYRAIGHSPVPEAMAQSLRF